VRLVMPTVVGALVVPGPTQLLLFEKISWPDELRQTDCAAPPPLPKTTCARAGLESKGTKKIDTSNAVRNFVPRLDPPIASPMTPEIAGLATRWATRLMRDSVSFLGIAHQPTRNIATVVWVAPNLVQRG
jgi:hypothetical protein